MVKTSPKKFITGITKKEVSAGIVVFSKDNKGLKFLLLQGENEIWNFPKGHLKKNETLEQAALREVWEETGLKIKKINQGFKEKISYYFQQNQKKRKQKIYKIVYFFLAQSYSKKVRLSYEHKKFIWASYEKALKKLKYKNLKKILKKANDFLSSIFI